MALAIGVDLGGTKIAAGVVDADGRIVAERRRPTPTASAGEVIEAIAELVAELHRWGFTTAGRPSKAVSDTLRWEMGRDRVRRRGRNDSRRIMYTAGAVPRSTAHRIITRVWALREKVVSLEGGQRPLFPD